MNSVFEKNLLALKANRTALYENLLSEIEFFKEHPEGKPSERFEWISQDGFTANFKLHRETPPFSKTYHADTPMEEVKKVLQEANLDYPQLVFIFGIGLGHLAKYFFEHRPARTRGIIILENNYQIFLRALCCHDFRPLIEDRSVSFLIEKSPGLAERGILSILSEYTTTSRFLKILGTPSAFESEPEFYEAQARSILKARDISTISVGNSVRDQLDGLENTMENLDRLIVNQGIQRLKNIFEGQTILSIAAGPSAGEHWERIRELKNRVPIIACDTLLKALNHQQISADFISALERVEVVASFFENVPVPERSSLVGPSLLHPKVFEAFQGRHMIYNPASIDLEVYGLQAGERLYPGSSAGNLNLAFAQYLGFKKIIMVGHDLAYGFENSQSHVSGTAIQSQDLPLSQEEIEKKSEGLKVPTQDGTATVYTMKYWNLFRQQIESLIASSPDVDFINTSPKGASIKGSRLLGLEEALRLYASKDLDIWQDRKHILEAISNEEKQRRAENFLQKSKDIIDRMDFWMGQIEPLLSKLEAWKEDISDKENRGKKVSMAYLDDRLNEVLRVKVQAVNNDKVFFFGFIQTISPYHLTFERDLNQMPGTYKDNYSLKRDFLLKHLSYFHCWKTWMPLVKQALSRGQLKISA
jgi:hypothetical protein